MVPGSPKSTSPDSKGNLEPSMATPLPLLSIDTCVPQPEEMNDEHRLLPAAVTFMLVCHCFLYGATTHLGKLYVARRECHGLPSMLTNLSHYVRMQLSWNMGCNLMRLHGQQNTVGWMRQWYVQAVSQCSTVTCTLCVAQADCLQQDCALSLQSTEAGISVLQPSCGPVCGALPYARHMAGCACCGER